MVSRRRFVTGVGTVLLAPVIAEAQPTAGKAARIGWLSSAFFERGKGPEVHRSAVEESLRRSGWAPNFELRYSGSDIARLDDMAAELVRLPVDLIIATDTIAAQAAHRVTRSVPIVICGLADPIGAGLALTLARPGGNVTGPASGYTDGVAGKWIELLREVRPIARVAVIWDPASNPAASRLDDIERAARTVGMGIQRLPLRSPTDVERVLEELRRGVVTGLIVDADLHVLKHAPVFIDAARTYRIPTMFPFASLARAGGLLAYGPSLTEIFRLVAVYADRILRGTKPADLPIERVTKYELAINLKTAKALGLTIPPSLLLRADHVIE